MVLTENYQLLKEIKMGFWYSGNTKLGTLYYRLYAKYNAETQKATLNSRIYNDGAWCESGNCYNEINDTTTVNNKWLTFYKGETDVGELTIDLTSKTSITARFKCYGLDSKWFSITLDIEPPFDKAIGLDFDIGSATNITITRYNENYTRTVVASIGTFSETLLEKGTDTQIAWQPAAEDLYKQIPNNNTGTITLTTTTYSGDTVIGTATSILKCRVTDSNPIVNSVTITDALAIVSSNILVRYLSKPKFEIDASALNGANIVSYSVTESNSTEKTSASNVITTENIVANNSFEIKVTDSRGNSTTATFSASNFIEYVLPAIAKLDLVRTGENLDQIQANISGIWFNQAINGTTNKIALKYRYKTNVGDYSDYIDIEETPADSQFVVETILAPEGGFDINSIYTIEVIAIDSLTSEDLTGLIGKAIPLIDHWSEDNKDYYNINAEIQQRGVPLKPIGSIHVTIQNINPGEELGGTWELVDKEFAPALIEDGFDINTTKTTSALIKVMRAGHNLDITGSFVNKVNLTDSDIEVGSFDMEKLGVSLFDCSRNPTGWSDGGNSVVYLDLANDGTLTTKDINYSLTSVAANNTWQFSINVTLSNLDYMRDEACNKFYWKRTA